ncbi:dihydrolipoyl dehydrogenase [Caproiciproducens sp.]
MNVVFTAVTGAKPGKIGKMSVSCGDCVQEGDVLVQVEVGKGNKTIRAPQSGRITNVFFKEGDEVASGQTLFELENEDAVSVCKLSEDEKQEEKLDTELLVIGGGPGGYVAAIYAAQKGIAVTLVEKSALGGTCLNVGCIPTKALIQASETFRHVREAYRFGVHVEGTVSVNMKEVIQRKEDVKNRLIDGIACLMEKHRIRVISGTASFVSATEVCVNGKRRYHITAKDIIVATGSRCSSLPVPGIDLPMVMNSTQALSSDDLPQTITIIGGGVIGMEFAFLYRNLGVQVHVVEFLDRLLAMLDEEVSQAIREFAEEAGIHVHTGSKVREIRCSEDGQAVISCEGKDGTMILVSDRVLAAVGREPNLESLNTENAGIRLREHGRGIAVDEHMRSNIENIYAIGDVTNILQLAHVASHQGIVAVENVLGNPVSMDYAAVPNVIFTTPEIASVGQTAGECRKKGIEIDTSNINYSGNGKAMIMNETSGFVKLVREKTTGKILGGSIIGADASALLPTLTAAVAKGLTDQELSHMIFAHPTTSEIIHEAAMDFGSGAIHQI